MMLGGPLSPPVIFLKLVAVPGAILGGCWWLTRKLKDPLPGVVAIIPSAVLLGCAVANNVVVVVAKKVRKVVVDGNEIENQKTRKEP
jgi:hypothetical protein